MSDQTHPGTTFVSGSAPATARPKRPVGQAMWRGFRGRCPHCGEGKLFTRFLKPVPTCPVCGEDLSHQRADDLPPYITLVVVGHIIVPLILFVETRWPLPTPVHLAIWLPLTLMLTLGLLQPVKGLVVGLQWALCMHGFDIAARSLADDTGGGEPGAALRDEQRSVP